MNKFLSLLFLLNSFYSFAQCRLNGTVKDEQAQTLVGVNIYVEGNTLLGSSTDFDGNFNLDLPIGCHILHFQYIGYKNYSEKVCLQVNQQKQLTITLDEDSELLSTVVVSAGKYEQNIEEVTISMDVIKPSFIENKAANSIDKTLKQAPSIHIVDGQANIRSGSGWSYGAGSRVMVMVDGMPIMSGDQGAAEWQLIPMENIAQVEIIKGASSVLFGSSALNGTINIRTSYPSSEPLNKISFTHSYYGAPKRKSLHWYKNGYYSANNLSLFHSQKKNNQDFILGANLMYDGGYQYKVTSKRARINFGYTKYSETTRGLKYGVKANLMRSEIGDAIIWDHDSLAYNPLDNDPGFKDQAYLSIDPYINYINEEKNSKHSLNTRYLHIEIYPRYGDSLNIEQVEATENNEAYADTSNYYEDKQRRFSKMFYIDYQYQKLYHEALTITSGLTNKFCLGQDADIYGVHKENNVSIYSQLDLKHHKLNLSIGGRYEHYYNGVKTITKPILRTGVNYQLGRATWLRSSYGEGIRFPSMLERFITYNTGPMYIYPNSDLTPESGWSAEIGLKQGFQIGAFKGIIDLAAFKMNYEDMMEFSFGLWGPPEGFFGGIGFKSINIGQTVIEGLELSMACEGRLGAITLHMMGSFTYTKPYIKDNTFVYALDNEGNELNYLNTSLNTNGSLKYRYERMAKFDATVGFKRSSIGIGINYQSAIKNIDAVFNAGIFDLLLGTEQAWNRLNKPTTITDMRFGYNITADSQIAVNIDNIFNVEQLQRPASLGAPRTYSLLYKHSF